MGYEVPKHFSLDLLTWQPVEIQLWLRKIGLSCYRPAFDKCCVLATMTEDEIEKEIEVSEMLTTHTNTNHIDCFAEPSTKSIVVMTILNNVQRARLMRAAGPPQPSFSLKPQRKGDRMLNQN